MPFRKEWQEARSTPHAVTLSNASSAFLRLAFVARGFARPLGCGRRVHTNGLVWCRVRTRQVRLTLLFQPLVEVFVFPENEEQCFVDYMFLRAADEFGIESNEFDGLTVEFIAGGFTGHHELLVNESH